MAVQILRGEILEEGALQVCPGDYALFSVTLSCGPKRKF